MQRIARRLLISLSFLLALSGCSGEVGEFYAAALGLNRDRVFVVSQIAQNLGVHMYTTGGTYLGRLVDYYSDTNAPRGIAYYDPFSVAISLDATDEIQFLNLDGSARRPPLSNNLLTGTIGKMIYDRSRDGYFIVETNGIEFFSRAGVRVPASGNSIVPGTAQAPCAALASLRALVLNNSGALITVQSAATASNRYTLGPVSATACAVVTLPTNANDIINHSDGNMYFVGTNNQVYRTTQVLGSITSIFNNVATISTPTALAEMPDGNLIVASDATDSIELISTGGTYRSTFARDSNTQLVHSLFILRGQ